MKYGYARVSTLHQNLERQLTLLKQDGCDKIYEEKASGKDLGGRAVLRELISILESGDILVIAEWDRATRSMMDGIEIIKNVQAAGATVRVLDKPYLDLTTPIGKGFLAMLSAMAEDERERITKRAKQGLREAVRRGVRLGRKPKLNEEQKVEARRMALDGKSQDEIGRILKVSGSTISRLDR